MEVIKMEGVSKAYTYYEKEKGVKGSIRNVIKKKQLVKEAVSNLNVSIEEGSIIGFIGLNGAGKTTTLKMLSGILKPTGGKITVHGFNPFDKKYDYLKRISMVMGNKSQLWWDIPAIDTFELNKEIFEVDNKTYKSILDELTEALDVKHLLNIQVRRLSLGERMKMELISALIHSPSVVFLDEPTIGLDIISQHNIREFLKSYNKNHRSTIILTSHNFDDIVSLCDRLLIIDKGKIICDDPFEVFIQKYSTKKILTVKFTCDAQVILNNIKNDALEVLERDSDGFRIAVNNAEVIHTVNLIMTNYAKAVKDINIEDVDIEAIIRNIYE